VRRALLPPLILVTTAVTLALIATTGMHLCRPYHQYQRERRALDALHAGQSRTAATAIVMREFEVLVSNSRTMLFRSRFDIPRECRCYPMMINVATVTFERDRVGNVEWHDDMAWPGVEHVIMWMSFRQYVQNVTAPHRAHVRRRTRTPLL
jgi:hypothetical protein